MTGRYPSEDRAFARAEILKRSGIWPSVRTHADGSASLTFDPADAPPQDGDR